MTDTVDKSIDEILRYFRGWVSLAGNSGEPMYKLGEYEQGELDEAKQSLLTLIEDLIGEDELSASVPLEMPEQMYVRLKGRDQLRKELRERLR